jgi:hypothetical protein
MSRSPYRILQALQQALRERPQQPLEEFWANLSEQPPQEAELVSEDLIRQWLYIEIVQPWERLKRRKQQKAKLRKKPATDWAAFEVLNLAPHLMQQPLGIGFVLEMMRNAISHDKLRFDRREAVVFSDWDNNRLRFSLDALESFVEAFRQFRAKR